MRIDVKAGGDFRNHRDFKIAAARHGLQGDVGLGLKNACRGGECTVLRGNVDGGKAEGQEYNPREKSWRSVAVVLARHIQAQAGELRDGIKYRDHKELDGNRAAELLGEDASHQLHQRLT